MSNCLSCGYKGRPGDDSGHMASCIEPHRIEGKKLLEFIAVAGFDNCKEQIVKFIRDVVGPGPSPRGGT